MKYILEHQYVRLEEISKCYDIPLSTLRRWASERRFPLYKVSNKIRISLQEFEQWFKNFHVKGGAN